MTDLTIRPYGAWPGTVDAQQLFSRPGPYTFPDVHQGHLYWIQSQPDDGGRLALMRASQHGAPQRVTPTPLNIRTRVHEYGGRAHILHNDHVIFANFADQCLWAQSLTDSSAIAHALTPATLSDDTTAMYADLLVHPNGRWLIMVLEVAYPQSSDAEQNLNAIACIDLARALRGEQVEPQILVQGADFYASPCLSPDGTRLAFFRWSHPNMPWDQSEVIEVALTTDDNQLQARDLHVVAGGVNKACCQVSYTAAGQLWWAMDEHTDDDAGPRDYWNWYTKNDRQSSCGAESDQSIVALTEDEAEYAAAHWVFGWQRCAHINADQHVAIRTTGEGDELVVIATGKSARVIESEFNDFLHIATVPSADRHLFGCDLVVIAGSDTRERVIAGVDLASSQLKVLRESTSLMAPALISRPRSIRVQTRDNEHTHAYFYAPHAPPYAGADTERAPVVVMVHGGPTSRTTPAFDPAKQFWTSRGFAVLDVNHRGSTGYGRAYRQRLCGNWGVIDATDVVDCIEWLVAQGLVDERRVCVRGGSAGGYVVLNVLTRFADTFAAGACYYGIGNLVTLCETTHKFEKYYVDVLVGQTYSADIAAQPDSVFQQRSPQHHAGAIRSAMILFQGSEDRVVPPEVSREMVACLAQLGIEHEYVEYPGEGHGFRQPDNRIDALQRELAFFRRALGIESDNVT